MNVDAKEMMDIELIKWLSSQKKKVVIKAGEEVVEFSVEDKK